MPHFSEKHCAYRAGCLCVILGFIGYTVAFGLPAWERIVTDDNYEKLVYGGLWQHTCNGLTSCQSYAVIVEEPLFQAARSIACICVALFCVSVFLLILHNCTAYGRKVQTENKIVSLLPVLSGLCGGISCAIYAAFVLRPDSGSDQIVVQIAWAFIEGSIGCIFGMFGGILMMIGSCNDRQRIIRETEENQTITTYPTHSSTTPMALVAVPVSFLANSGSQTSIPMAVLASNPTAQPVSGVAQNYVSAPPVQSSAPPMQSTEFTGSAQGPQGLATGPLVEDTPREDPSAPPPEMFYY